MCNKQAIEGLLQYAVTFHTLATSFKPAASDCCFEEVQVTCITDVKE